MSTLLKEAANEAGSNDMLALPKEAAKEAGQGMYSTEKQRTRFASSAVLWFKRGTHSVSRLHQNFSPGSSVRWLQPWYRSRETRHGTVSGACGMRRP